MAEDKGKELLQDFDSKWIDVYKQEIDDRAEEIDPSNNEDWFSMTLGWAIAKGMSIDAAGSFAVYIRHHTDMG